MSEYLTTTFEKFELRVHKQFHYARDDLWVNVERGQAKVGMSDYLQKTSGDVAFIELTKAGSTAERGKTLGTMESAKATVELLSPISGRIEETNDALVSRPELVNSDPYGEGWLVTISPSNLEDDLQALLSADDYYQLMLEKLKREHEKLGSR